MLEHYVSQVILLVCYLFNMIKFHNSNCCIVLTLKINKVLNNPDMHLAASVTYGQSHCKIQH